MGIKQNLILIKLLFSLVFVFSFISCSSQRALNITFVPQNKQTIQQYLIENKIVYQPDDIFVLKDFAAFVHYNNEDKLLVPEIYFFNKDGQLVKNKFNKNECTQVIQDIDRINSMKAVSTQKLSDWLLYLSGADTSSAVLVSQDYDYYIIINWAIFGEEMNDRAFEWYSQMRGEILNGKKIKCYLLNLDVQQMWNLTDAQKKVLGIKTTN